MLPPMIMGTWRNATCWRLFDVCKRIGISKISDRLAISDNNRSLTQWSIVFGSAKQRECGNGRYATAKYWVGMAQVLRRVVNWEFFLGRILKRTSSCCHGTLSSQLPELFYLAVHLMKKDKNNTRSIASLIDQIAPPVIRFCQKKAEGLDLFLLDVWICRLSVKISSKMWSGVTEVPL